MLFSALIYSPLSSRLLGLGLALWIICQAGFHKPLPTFIGTSIGAIAIGLYLSITILKCDWNGVNDNTSIKYRNFYGTLRVDLENSGDSELRGLRLYHGNTFHGFQFTDPKKRKYPTTYYALNSGLGAAFKHLQKNNKSLP